MNLLMISGDRSVLRGRKGAFWYTLQELSRHWERIDVLCPHGPVPEGAFFGNVHFHPSPRGLWYQPLWIRSRGTELATERAYGVMTVHEFPPFYNGIGARWLSRLTGIPVVLEIHHVVGHPEPASATEAAGLALGRVYLPGAIKAARATRTVSSGVRETLISFGADAAKLHVVPSFYLDASVLRPDPSIKKTVDIVFCGRIVPNKGLKELLKAVALLPAATLLVIGDGSELRHCRRQAQALGIADRVRFAGWLPAQEDVVAAIQSGKIFVMNSRSEGGPRVALEAMACGMPLIATRVGVMPDVLEDGVNGLMTTGSSGDLAQKIRTLLQDDALRARLGAAATGIVKRFERATLIKNYADFLRSASALP